jgi:hypothetical protein
MIAVGYLDYTRFPWFDGWDYWTEYLSAANPWTVLFDRLNEHRVVVTRLLSLADTTWFRADTRLLLWSSFAAQFGTSALLYRMTTASFLPSEIWSSHAVKSRDAVLRLGPVDCGSGSSIGLPLMTSTTTAMIRVSVVERGTGNVLATASPPPGLATWDLWRLDVPAGAPAMTCDYIVEDRDNDPASWIATGLPRAISP